MLVYHFLGKNMITMYTDGACKGNPGVGGWGVYIKDSLGEIEICGYGGKTTNVKMEMMAVIEGLKAIKDQSDSILIYSDSQLVVKGINEWLQGWKKKGWRTTTGEVKNVELWKEIDVLIKDKSITCKWVKGHSDDYGNEYADSLANKGAAGENFIKRLASSVVIEKKAIVLNIGDFIEHEKGGKYLIIGDNAYLEHNAQVGYLYISIDADAKVWNRVASEVTDGRFKVFNPSEIEKNNGIKNYQNYINNNLLKIKI
jgi:ribonuclease HI